MSAKQTQSTIIQNITQLREYLQVALKLEHATIPPYLTTAYTAKLESNKPSVDILRAVAKEEMLHLLLVGNLLNAVGGTPDLTSDDFVPSYPTHLPTGDTTFEVNIERFSHAAIETFLKIERPTQRPRDVGAVEHVTSAVPIQGADLDKSIRESPKPLVPVEKKEDGNYQLHYDVLMIPHDKLSPKRQQKATKSFLPAVQATDTEGNEVELHYWSIGEFYQAISLGFVELSKIMPRKKLFCGDSKRQIGSISYYSGGGHAHEVTDLKSALAALELIAGQGEGYNNEVYDAENEIAHYYRFDQIRQGRYYRVPDKYGKNGDDPGKPQGGKFPVDMKAVYPIKANAKIADYDGNPELVENALLFNGQYKDFLGLLNDGFNGKPELLDPRTGAFAKAMFQIKVAMERLIHVPIPGNDENASPTFEMNRCKSPSTI